MLEDRGYDVVQHANLAPTLDEFRSRFGQHPNPRTLAFCASHRSHPNNTVHVMFAGTDVIRKGNVGLIYTQNEGTQIFKRLILIVQSRVTPYAYKEFKKWPFEVEIFHITDLLVNITKHVMQPKYEILTDDEKKELFTKYNLVEDNQLPGMLKTDPIARYYGLKKGQVLKVTHSSQLIESYVTYRCVQ
uniref:DNA-directed RNA polymerases I, II, and III subunit RPABC1 n=2 Tax=Cajanus cajan TaxID=3821 RepID=A0A151RNM3_CAJCA|nr:DNA-directed RNA polymerases I, II, and III subunit RPABC1 [Cajanus cajan]